MTIAEIAARAGVSKTAVSRYLNDGYVSEEKREAIRKIIEETGYVPSRHAQMLRTGRSGLVGVILPRIDSESISRVVRGIGTVLDENEFQLLLANTNNDEQRELSYLEVFRRGQVDGILLVATMLTPAHREAMQRCTVPLVVVGQHTPLCSCVYHDDAGAAQALTRHLIDLGRRRIAYIGVTPRDRAVGHARREGVCTALEEAGLVWDDALAERTDFSMQGGRAACERLLARGADFDGLFCATDSIAIGAMQALHAAGRQTPQDVAVVGMGHSRMSELIHPTLTTAHYYYEKSGEEAARLLMNAMQDENPVRQQLCLGFEIMHGESSCGKD